VGLADRLRGAASAAIDAVEGLIDPVAASNRQFDDHIEKAAEAAKAEGKDGEHDIGMGELDLGKPVDSKALHFDPFDLVAAMGYREKPSPLTFLALDRVGSTVPVIADIINTRINQSIMFCNRPNDRHATGFEVRPKDPDAELSPADKKYATQLEDLLLKCGGHHDDRVDAQMALVAFAKMFLRQSLSLDQATFEVVPDRKGRPVYFDIVDATTVRLLDPAYRDPGDPFAVQVINGSIVADFTRPELAFCVRNPRAGIRSYGYGYSEIESAIREITGFLWGMEYNKRWFSNGTAARGILNFRGTMNEKQLRALRRQWYAMASGISNAWRTPITNAQEVEWVNMQLSNRDMEYTEWINFLIKIFCARYNIAPEEIQFSFGNTGQSQAMGQSPHEEKIKSSKDLGLRPLVLWFFAQLNDHYLSLIAPEWQVAPVGLDSKGEEAEVGLLKDKCAVFMTIDEARAVQGMEPIGKENGGDVIENPQWVQWQLAQQQNQMMEEGAPGSDDQGYLDGEGEGAGAPQEDEFSFGEDFELDGEDEGAGEISEPAVKSRVGDRARARYTLDL
jgi:hypothetical protein